MGIMQPVYDSIRDVLRDSPLQEILERRNYPNLFKEDDASELLEREREGIPKIDLTPRQLNAFNRDGPTIEFLIDMHIYLETKELPFRQEYISKDREGRIIFNTPKTDGRTLSEKVLGKIFYDN